MVSPFQNSDVLQGCQHYSKGLTFMECFLCAKHFFFSCNFHTNCSSYIFVPIYHIGGLPSSLVVKNPPANSGDARDRSSIPGSEDSLEEGMAAPSSMLGQRIPGTEEPGRLESIGLHRVRHDWSNTYAYARTTWEGLPRWLGGEESTCQCRRCRFNPWVGKVSWRRKWLPTPVFLPGKSHGQRSLAGNSPQGGMESSTTWQLNNYHHHTEKQSRVLT